MIDIEAKDYPNEETVQTVNVIVGPATPCANSKAEYSFCPTIFPYHWRWTVTGDASARDLGTRGENCYVVEVILGKQPTTLTFHQSNPIGVPQVQDVLKFIQPRECENEREF